MKAELKWAGLLMLALARLVTVFIFHLWIELVASVLLGLIIWGWGETKPKLVKERPKELRDSFSDAYDIAVIFLIATIFGLYVVARTLASAACGIESMFVALLWSSACVVAGAGLGFLFGIPKVLSEQPAPRTKDQAASDANTVRSSDFGYQQRVNSNLEEISDWLTKIIVGLGLVELGKVFDYFKQAAAVIGVSVRMAHFAGQGFGAGLIIFFSGVGFLGSYLLTRLFLAGAFFRAERDTNVSALLVTDTERSALQQVAETSLAAASDSIRKSGTPEGAVRRHGCEPGGGCQGYKECFF
jgi:hypothetical protein